MTQEALKFNKFMKFWILFSLIWGCYFVYLVAYYLRIDFFVLFLTYFVSTFFLIAFSKYFWKLFWNHTKKIDVNEVLKKAWMPSIPLLDNGKIELSYTLEAFNDLKNTFDIKNPNATYISFPKAQSLSSILSSSMFFHELGHLKQIMENGENTKYLKDCIKIYKNPSYEQIAWIFLFYGFHLAMYFFNVQFSPLLFILLWVIYFWRFLNFLQKDIFCELDAYRQTLNELREHCKEVEDKIFQSTIDFVILVGISSYIAFYFLGCLFLTTLF